MSDTTLRFDLLANDRASKVFDKVGGAASDTESKFARFGQTIVKVGKLAAVGVAAGLGLATVAGVKFAKAAAEDQQQAELLAGALKRNADATDGQIASTENWISAQGRAFGVADDDLRPALSRLVTATHDVGDAQKLASLAMDVSAGSGKSLEAVSTALMKAQNGQVSSLSRLGINVKNAAGETISMNEAVKRMSDTFGGAASDKAKTFQGRMDRLKLMMSETGEAIGYKLLPILTDLMGWIQDTAVPTVGSFFDAWKDRTGAIGQIRGVLEDLYDKVKTVVGNVVSAVQDAAPRIKDAVTSWATAVSGFFQSVVVNVTPFIAAITTALDSGDWAPVGLALGSALAVAIAGAGAAIGKMTEALGGLLSKIDFVGLGISMGKQAPAVVIGFAVGLINFDFGSLLKGLWSHWQEILLAGIALFLAPAKFVGKVGEMLAKIPFVGRLLEWGLNAIKGFVDNVGGAIGNGISHLGGAFLSGFRKVFPGIGSAFGEALAVLPTRVGIAAIEVAENAGQLMAKLRNAIVSRIDNVASGIGELVGKIVQGLGGLAAKGLSAGMDLARGLINGIKALAGQVMQVAADLAQQAVNAIKSKLHIGSPSKVTYQLGQWFTQGFEGGIKDKTKAALAAVGELTKRAVDKLKDLKAQAKAIKDGVASAMTGALDVANLGAIGEDGVQLKVTDQLSNFAASAGQFATALAQAAAKGLNSDLIAKVANLGPTQGLTAAQALAAMSAAEVASANASLDAVDKYASRLGQTVLTTTSLPEDIARQQGILDTLSEIRKDLRENPGNISFTVNDATDPDKVVQAIRKWLRQHGKKAGDL